MSNHIDWLDLASYTDEEIKTANRMAEAFMRERDEAWANDPALKKSDLEAQGETCDD